MHEVMAMVVMVGMLLGPAVAAFRTMESDRA
jgi:hypothetical protein